MLFCPTRVSGLAVDHIQLIHVVGPRQTGLAHLNMYTNMHVCLYPFFLQTQ